MPQRVDFGGGDIAMDAQILFGAKPGIGVSALFPAIAAIVLDRIAGGGAHVGVVGVIEIAVDIGRDRGFDVFVSHSATSTSLLRQRWRDHHGDVAQRILTYRITLFNSSRNAAKA
jgi:hypothetical protein